MKTYVATKIGKFPVMPVGTMVRNATGGFDVVTKTGKGFAVFSRRN